jgi:polyhydroxybutyrate depolymerase
MRIHPGVFTLLASLCACIHRIEAPPSRVSAAAVAPALPPVPSAGCRAGATRGHDGLRTITSGGRTRRFLLRVPQGGAAGDSAANAPPVPAGLVLNFHGLFEPAPLQETLSRMTEAAAARGWVVVYPFGLGSSWNAGVCCGRAKAEGVDDVRFVRELVAQLSRELCLDRRRVYATGMSNGGLFSYRLACEASDVVAAIAPVSGVEAAERCTPRRPVPVMAFHGTGDFIVPYKGGWYDLPSAGETQARWAARNRCVPGSLKPVFARGEVTCEAAHGCEADDVLCTVKGGGHTWPGGVWVPYLGHTTADIDATEAMLDFFAANPRR